MLYNAKKKGNGRKMPSSIIHVCLAKEYARKHKVKNEKEFVAGTIYPDHVPIKGETHYSDYYSSDTNLYQFLLDKKLDSSFNEGYFLHLLADCIFYNKYFPNHRKKERSQLMNDFHILSTKLIQKYEVLRIPKEVQKDIRVQEGETVEYHYEKVIQSIEEISNYELHGLAKRILEEKDFKFLIKEEF